MTKPFIKLSFLVALLVGLAVSFLNAADRPNIILILADDTGYTDLGAFAERLTGTPTSEQFYETPNLDKLVNEGTAFAQAYACPLCSPTRSSILTGRFINPPRP